MAQLSRLGKRERANLSAVVYLNYVVAVWRGFLILWVLGMGYVILFWHSLSLSYNYFAIANCRFCMFVCLIKCFTSTVNN